MFVNNAHTCFKILGSLLFIKEIIDSYLALNVPPEDIIRRVPGHQVLDGHGVRLSDPVCSVLRLGKKYFRQI